VIGGGGNWDYRYTWIRGRGVLADSLLRLGFTETIGSSSSPSTATF